MNIYQTLTIIWVAAVVLVLAVAAIGTGLALRRARGHLGGVAQDLEKVSGQAAPLEPKLESLISELQGVAQSLIRIDAALGRILEVVGGLVARK
ncbi:MAG: hypothetical protein M1369_02425 [Deinococcus sp.]|nr:hypothetical protein [Deinococcus sp.]MCL5964629.1 hypothetical protein [Deinococcus sp.]